MPGVGSIVVLAAHPAGRKALLLASAIVAPPLLAFLGWDYLHQAQTRPVLDAVYSDAATFDTAARTAPVLHFTNTLTEQPSDLSSGGTSTTSGWWNPSTGATQYVTDSALTTFTVCAPADTPNPDGFTRPGDCLVRHYDPTTGTATGWYAGKGGSPLTGVADYLSSTGVPTADGDIKLSVSAAGENGSYQISTQMPDTQHTVDIGPDTARLGLANKGYERVLEVTLGDTAPPELEISLDPSASRTAYTESMTVEEAAQLTAQLTGR